MNGIKMQITNLTDEQKFIKWCKNPLKTIKNIPNGDGGFIALVYACHLYEKYVAIKLNKKEPTINNIVTFLVNDFRIKRSVAKDFWILMRHGISHEAFPKNTKKWSIVNAKLPITELVIPEGKYKQTSVNVVPFLFIEKVIGIFEADPKLMSGLNMPNIFIYSK